MSARKIAVTGVVIPGTNVAVRLREEDLHG